METPEIKRPDDEEREHVLVTEWDGLSPLPAGATDAHLLEDADALPTWDIARESLPSQYRENASAKSDKPQMDEPRIKAIQPPWQAFYIQSMLFNTMSATRSIEEVNAMLAVARENSPENPYGVLYGTRFLADLQNLIVHAGALSRYFWATQPSHRWRGAELRDAFQIADDNPLRNRDLRNAIEHFDERLDDYLGDGIFGNILPEYIGPAPESDGPPFHIFRAYYVDTVQFRLLDKTYDIQPIAGEVVKVHRTLLKMDQGGGVFGR
jgi:hypothetical protein